MRKLFCVIVTDPNEASGMLGPISPIVFHIESISQEEAEEFVKENLIEEHGYSLDEVEEFEILPLEVIADDIIRL